MNHQTVFACMALEFAIASTKDQRINASQATYKRLRELGLDERQTADCIYRWHKIIDQAENEYVKARGF